MHQNKPLTEYGDLQSEHHALKHEAEKAARREAELHDEPPKLMVKEGPGNLYKVEWSYGNAPVPFECHGHWNHGGKARDAIKGAEARMRRDAAAKKVAAESKPLEEAIAEEEAPPPKKKAAKKKVA